MSDYTMEKALDAHFQEEHEEEVPVIGDDMLGPWKKCLTYECQRRMEVWKAKPEEESRR